MFLSFINNYVLYLSSVIKIKAQKKVLTASRQLNTFAVILYILRTFYYRKSMKLKEVVSII